MEGGSAADCASRLDKQSTTDSAENGLSGIPKTTTLFQYKDIIKEKYIPAAWKRGTVKCS
jgi:hypothetical protein